jgi:predicted metal-dependent phosphotriesterase family hydrolase
MCDFAHDPEEVRNLLVGRVLTLGSVLRALLAFGIKKQDVKTMLVDNPAKLMWLD